MEKLVSIIIPVYGVERFVGKCMQSLLSQSYDRIEYLVIDDCSQDDSISIIKNIVEKYPNRMNAVQILTH